MTSSSSLLGLILSFCPFFPFSHQLLVCEYCLGPSRALSRHLNSHVENNDFVLLVKSVHVVTDPAEWEHNQRLLRHQWKT